MATVNLVRIPPVLNTTVIASTDTNPIQVVAASSGKIVKLWGLVVAGGTSVLISSNSTALTGVITTTGLMMPPPRGNPGDAAYPWLESAVGETIKITPGASGLNGIAYYTQE